MLFWRCRAWKDSTVCWLLQIEPSLVYIHPRAAIAIHSICWAPCIFVSPWLFYDDTDLLKSNHSEVWSTLLSSPCSPGELWKGYYLGLLAERLCSWTGGNRIPFSRLLCVPPMSARATDAFSMAYCIYYMGLMPAWEVQREEQGHCPLSLSKGGMSFQVLLTGDYLSLCHDSLL